MLNELQKVQVIIHKNAKGKHLKHGCQPRLFVDKYEKDPSQFKGRNQKIRYEANKRGFTLGELEILLGLTGGSISSSSHSVNPVVDETLSLFFDIPQSELRVTPAATLTSRNAKIKKIVSLLRNLADELETT